MISFTSQVGNLFNQLGAIGGVLKELKTTQTSLLTLMINTTNGVTAQYETEPDVQAIYGSAYIGMLNGVASSVGSTSQQQAAAGLNRVVFRDNPQFNQTLTQANTLTSLLEVIRQMEVAGASVLAMTITATPDLFTNTVTNEGNGVIVMSTKRPLDGRVMENSYAETITITCISDSFLDGATEGNEGFVATGEGAQTNFFAFDWPLGSNCSAQFNAIDGSQDNTSGNILTNSGFDEWTDNVPDNWELVVGTAGTNIYEETGIVFGTGSSLALVGDAGGTLTEIKQEFNSSDGTSGSVGDLSQYATNLWLRRDGVAAATGVLAVELVNDGDVVINDELGTPNSFTIDLTLLTTEFAAYNVAFRTPHDTPETVFIRLRLTTGNPLENGRTVYIDRMGFGEMTQLGTNLCSIACFSGSLPFQTPDRTTAVITTSRGAGGTLSTFQTLMFQLFPDLVQNELLLPSASSPTILDSLIP